MSALRIMVCPVQDTALGVPLILSVERDGISSLQIGDTISQINIMSNQQGLPGCHFQNKSLVLASFCIIGQNFDDSSPALHLNVILLILKCSGQAVIGLTGAGYTVS